MGYNKRVSTPPKSYKKFRILTSPTPDMYPDNSVPKENKFLIARNKIRWNKWMSVLARCPICEEESALEEIEMLNEEFIRLVTDKPSSNE